MKSKKSHKNTHPTIPTLNYNQAELERQLHLDAKGLGLHPGAADAFIGRVLRTISTQITHRQITNDRQLHAAIYRELKKYHPDFAYIFQNRDKIV